MITEVDHFVEHGWLLTRSHDDVVALQQWVGETLATFKVPTYIERWDGKLPRNAAGKLLKNVLRGEGHVSFAETM